MTEKKDTVSAAAAASALCVALVCSAGFANGGYTQWLWAGGALFAFDVAFAWAVAFLCIRALLLCTPAKPASAPAGRLTRFLHMALPGTWDARGIACSALLMLAVWVPVLLFTWPGGSSPDTINMLYQYASPAPTAYWTSGTVVNAEFIDHHPVLDSLICGAFWQLGGLFGNHAWGFFLFSLANFALASSVAGAMVCYMASRLLAPRGLVLASQSFLMFFPVFPAFFSYMSKDAIFVPWFMLWMLLFLDWWRTGGVPSGKRLAAFVLVGLMCLLTKKLAIFFIVPGILVLAVHLRSPRPRIAALLGIAVSLALAFAVFPALVYPLAGGVAPGGRQEVLGTPINQVVTLYEEDPGAFSDEEVQVLDRVVNLRQVSETWRDGNPFRVDRSKDGFRQGAADSDVDAFLGLWLKKGFGHPLAYGKATYSICMPYFMPTQGMRMNGFLGQYYDERRELVEDLGLTWVDLDLHQPTFFHDNQIALCSSIEAAARLPGIGMFFTIGFYSGWLPFFCFLALALRRPRALWGLAPIGAIWLLQLLNPAALVRYALPLIVLAPLYLAWTIYELKRKEPCAPR